MSEGARICFLVALSLAAVAACSRDDSGTDGMTEYEDVRQIVATLSDAGIECELDEVRDADELARIRKRAEARRPTPDPYVQYVELAELPVRESGLCVFADSPEVAGVELASVITVYEDRRHLRSVESARWPGMATVYGANWVITLAAPDLGREAADALGGRINPPFEIPPEEVRASARDASTGCFLGAMLRPDLDRVTADLVDANDLRGLAEWFALPMADTEWGSVAAARCLEGLRMSRALREDARALRTERFRRFWMDLCDAAPTGFPVTDRLGLGEADSHEEAGRKLTRSFLGPTTIPAADVRDLARACGKRFLAAHDLPDHEEIAVPGEGDSGG